MRKWTMEYVARVFTDGGFQAIADARNAECGTYGAETGDIVDHGGVTAVLGDHTHSQGYRTTPDANHRNQ